jgi:hypothetical protein
MSSVYVEFGLTCLAAMLSPTTLTFTVLRWFSLGGRSEPERGSSWGRSV